MCTCSIALLSFGHPSGFSVNAELRMRGQRSEHLHFSSQGVLAAVLGDVPCRSVQTGRRLHKQHISVTSGTDEDRARAKRRHRVLAALENSISARSRYSNSSSSRVSQRFISHPYRHMVSQRNKLFASRSRRVRASSTRSSSRFDSGSRIRRSRAANSLYQSAITNADHTHSRAAILVARIARPSL